MLKQWKWAAMVAVLCGLLMSGAWAQEQPKLTRGEDLVETPAIGEGLCVHNLFQSNMVLQRDKPIAIWGWADPGEQVTVTLAGQSQTATAAADRSWKLTLPAMAAHTDPLTMTIAGKGKTITLDNILIGDVWVLGGQSNMEFPIYKVENGALEVVSANFPNIRILAIPQKEGPEPRRGFDRLYQWNDWFHNHYRRGNWDVCTPDNVRELSAIGYVFVRRLNMATQVPIGVVNASRGGTTVETWTPEDVLRKIDAAPVKQLLAEWDEKIKNFDPQADLQQRIENYNRRHADMLKDGKPISPDYKPPTDLQAGPAANHNRPGMCYAGMIAPIAGLSVKGAIFHQGYNNCFDGSRGAKMYAAVFPEMIKAWRAAFNDPDMPFGILSLCTSGDAQTPDNFLSCMLDAGAYIRDAQYKTYLDLLNAGDKNIGFVSTYDLRRRWYHPQLKVPAGERVARWALATQYDMKLDWKPAMLKAMKVEDGKILLTYDQVVGPVDDGRPMEGFAIAGDDHHFQPATSTWLQTGKDSRGRPQYDSKVIVLSSPLVPHPTQYRYAWARSPMGNVQGPRADVPLPTQRSDNWGMGEVPLQIAGDDAEFSRDTMNAERKAFQLDDMKRRLFEAQQYIDQNKETYEKAVNTPKQ